MNIERASVKDLLYASYRYNHCSGACDSDCSSCPCYNEDYDCSEVYAEIESELDRRWK